MMEMGVHLVAGEDLSSAFGISSNFSGQRRLMSGQQHYGIPVVGGGSEVVVVSSHSPPPLPPPPPAVQRDGFWFIEDGGGGAKGRWPRQETLILLEIRTRLDFKFREATQKAPLWDEVARIMAEEHGYQRSGKKCREKLENLYKYYKKTKEGKTGRQDGKHYRFFKQLEALYGDNHHPTTNSAHVTAQEPREAFQIHWPGESHGFSDSTDLDTTSMEEETNGSDEDRSSTPTRSWKSKTRELVEIQVRRFMELQEAWLDKMLMTLDHMEQERICREEARRKQEAAQWDEEHRLWASERAWIEARDVALMDALEKISRSKSNPLSPKEFTSMNMDGKRNNHKEIEGGPVDDNVRSRLWLEPSGGLWEDISTAISCLGFKDELQNNRETEGCTKKRRQEPISPYNVHLKRLHREGHGGDHCDEEAMENLGVRPSGEHPSSSDDCFCFAVGGGESL